MISFDQVTISYADAAHPVLRQASFTIPEGDLCLVVGRTGTGKSTLLGAINALVPWFSGGTMSGEVRIDGRSTRDCRPRELADLVGWVGQNPLVSFVTDRVEDELAYGMEQLGLSPAAMRKRVEETLDLMNIADLRGRALTELSGGQQQRVAIAAVLAAQPRVLVLDEPTSALDPTAAQDVLGAITTLVHDVGMTVVLAEHRLERVMQAADSVAWLDGTGGVQLGPARELLGRCDVVPPLAALARRLDWQQVPLSVREARRRVIAEELRIAPAPEPWRPGPDGALAVELQGLSVQRGDVLAVNDLRVGFAPGTITALMGRNGAGKSSLLWAMQGALPSTGGLVVGGRDPRAVDAATARSLVTLVPQSAADLLYLHSVEQECAQADAESGVPAGTTAALLQGLGADLPPERHPRDLSEGQRLALVLAIQLASEPGVILLDEPTRGLDYEMKEQLRTILRRLAADGRCILLSTHDVEFAAACCDRTLVMADGDVVADGPTREVLTSSPAFAPQVAKVFRPSPLLSAAEVRRLAP
ncbi:ABC transporter ATP-binding protein [Luteococcus peritonei]|uniref:ABC transporter ATP-binding protein n=1 Tax=Luteococcus peritonei TaxID=88874 RepID=A0ABW4RTV7_9ACTN